MRATLLLALTLLGCSGAFAGERALAAAETRALLAGNTVISTNERGETRQYFAESGETDYVAADGKRSSGQWRMEADRYCSLWPPAERWSCYTVTGDTTADPPTIVWTDAAGFAAKGSLQRGNRLQ